MAISAVQMNEIEFAGSIKLVTNTVTIASQILSLASPEAFTYVPWLSIITSPLSVYSIIQDVRSHTSLVRLSKRVSDIAFWCMRAVDAVAGGLGGMLKPILGSISLAGVPSSPVVETIFKHVLPHTLFGISIVGCVVESWALGRTIKDYRSFRNEVKSGGEARKFLEKARTDVESARFKEVFKRFEQHYDQMTDDELLQAMLDVSRFSIYDHANGVVCAIMGIVASALLMFGCHYVTVSSALVLTAASLKITSVIIKNMLIRKSENMVKMRVCQNPNDPLLASSTSQDS